MSQQTSEAKKLRTKQRKKEDFVRTLVSSGAVGTAIVAVIAVLKEVLPDWPWPQIEDAALAVWVVVTAWLSSEWAGATHNKKAPDFQ